MQTDVVAAARGCVEEPKSMFLISKQLKQSIFRLPGVSKLFCQAHVNRYRALVPMSTAVPRSISTLCCHCESSGCRPERRVSTSPFLPEAKLDENFVVIPRDLDGT